MKIQNRLVREEFSDTGGDDWLPDISLPRSSLRVACTITDDDGAIIVLVRLFLYYVILRKMRDLVHPVYGSVIGGDAPVRRHRPQITLFFLEDFGDIEPGYSPVTGEISFRLMEPEDDNLTEAKIEAYARKIKTEFAANGGFVWKKGWESSSYTHWERGYQLQLLVWDKTEGKRIVGKVLDIQRHTPDWKRFNHSENDKPSEAFPIVPGNQTILGKSRKKHRKRPKADVRFQYALLKIDGLPHPIPLVDRSGVFLNPIERVL